MTFLTLDKVSHYYFSTSGYTKALDDISLSIEEGEFVSIIGPSGCGKSTILSIIARLMKQTEGEITLKKESLMNSPLNIGYMLQQDYLFPWKTIMANILLGPKVSNNITENTISQARKLLDEVNLKHTEHDYPSELSGGMRQRVALVRTLIKNPEILLFDEPFSALDYVTKLKLENLVAKMMKTYNKTAILVTHDLGEAISMSDRIFLMDATPGKIIKTFFVPKELREEEPFFVRRHPKYQALFDEVWQHLNKEKGMTLHERND
ncbi:ABC transporter ATP-binding protein [Pseudogracilibacillus auburnensis]|uniref:NitT/TauT family transport system ATP-binding protein n=1 Tax=Pseudogracilibacillus auburnensis TaxID=1494959 RepID=A0A2V3VMZ8_9BACI|nr:ABC transporter ATP-binding protein [Pseudogracilibacillus auburnensis]PXW81395.1 NitT/TauT family transport system ATP-binding protein [Pseudogracilibacillus auburnensis]